MKLLVIDNQTIALKELKKALKGYDYELVSYAAISPGMAKDYEKIILSGGHAFSVLHSNKKYSKELDLIKKAKIPIFGICLGFQLICRAYGANMHDISDYEHCFLKITKIHSDPLLKGLPKNFIVYENHRHVVKKVNKSLISLAYSKDGIEAVKHRSKPIWGVQFHPEHFAKKNLGRKMLENFLKL